jgi:iron-sulfur cluster assembly accessory protein
MEMQFYISDAANLRLKELAKKKAPGPFLRISVLGGGCSGFEYKYDFEASKNQDDYIFSSKNQDISIIIDPMFHELLKGSTLDYTNEIGKTGFKINNPQASSQCGCGKSFSFNG